MEHLEVTESPLGDTEEDSLKKQNSSWTSQAWVDPQEVFFYSAAQEHVSYLRRKTQQNSHLSKYKTKAQRTRNFAFEVRKNASLLLPSERDHWGVNNIIPYMCSKTLPSSVFLFKLFSTLRSVPYFSSKSPSQPHQVTLFAAIKTC